MPARPTSPWRFGAALGWITAGLTAALGLRTAFLFFSYTFGRAGVRSYHVEAAATAFVILAVATLFSRRHDAMEPASERRIVSRWWWLVFAGAAVALYWPALFVGPLSDDFILIARADRWQIDEVTPALFRPLPLALWAVLRGLGAGAVVLHALNLVVHGTVAYLTARIAEAWLPARKACLLAGGLVLSFPLLVEPVAWISGAFDLIATALVLTAVLLAREYGQGRARRVPWLFLIAGLGAIASKETAVVTPVLVALDAFARRRWPSELKRDVVLLAIAAAAFSAARLYAAFGIASPPLGKYVLQQALFETFGALAVPWHADILSGAPWIAIGWGWCLIGAVGVFAVAGAAGSRRAGVTCLAWVAISVAPVFPIVFIGADLQGARYLYLASPTWAILLVVMAWGIRVEALRRVAAAAAVAAVGLGAAGVRWHLRPWTEAAVVRDRVVRAAAANRAIGACGAVTLDGLPDHVRGAYVFRNGAAESLAAAAGIRVVGDAPDSCRFRWDADLSAFTRAR